MHKLQVRARYALAFASFLVILVAIAGPQLYALILWHWLARTPEGERRGRIRRLVSFWGSAVFRIVVYLMKMRVRFRKPRNFADYGGGPFIAVPNHQSFFDILVMIADLRRLGCKEICWIAKSQLLGVPIVGRLLREMGCALVDRNGIGGDIMAVRYSATLARKDGATCYLLFPEGKRFTKADPKSGFANVLPPKPGGFMILCSTLKLPVYSPTLSWSGRHGAKTILDAESLYGRTVEVRGRVAEVAPDPERAKEWLFREWMRKDLELVGTAEQVAEAG